jgi:hypothetical protein
VSVVALLEAVALEVAAEGGDRDASFGGAAFWFDVAGGAVPASFDVDQVLLEVDVVPVKRLKVADAQPGVEGCRPDRSFVEWERGEQSGGLCGDSDPVVAGADAGEGEFAGWVERDLAAVERAPIHCP